MLLTLLAGCLGAGAVQAQNSDLPFPPIDPSVRVMADRSYGDAGGQPLMFDLYRPPAGETSPVLVFFIRATGQARRQRVYDRWARAAASHGLAAVLPDMREGHEVEDFDRLTAYLGSHAATLGVDVGALAVFSPSGNVATALPVVEDPRRTVVKAAVMYYGTGTVASFRRDLPLLLVRAGLDRPSMNEAVGALAARAFAENAPVTVLNHNTGHHGFEIYDPDEASRDVIERTIAFVHEATSAAVQAAIRRGQPEVGAAAAMQNGRFTEAVEAYGALHTANPTDARLGLSYGEALLAAGRAHDACVAFGALKGQDLGVRDLGIPAAQACALSGDADGAVAWLAGIPARFRSPDLLDDPAFASLRARADFRALFERK